MMRWQVMREGSPLPLADVKAETSEEATAFARELGGDGVNLIGPVHGGAPE
jgi:hypothetical protein